MRVAIDATATARKNPQRERDARCRAGQIKRCGFHVEGIRLPGHGVGPEAMAWVTWRDWEQAAEEGLRKLSGFSQVFVAGLSMGALLGMLLAARHPNTVKGLALMAPV